MTTSKVLIVDDEHANQFLLDGLLTANGYKTIIASDGEECLKTLEKELPDLILLDIMMPHMSGIQVLQKIMEHPQWKEIPVIMVTAKTSVHDIQEAMGIGAIDYIKKPFEEMELLARVKVGIRLKLKEDHLRELVQQREEFVRIISHDLRSPFIAISGFAEMIMNDENLTSQQNESLKRIVESISFSQDYFNRLLSWAKLEQGDIELNKSNVDLSRLINSCYQFYQSKADKKEIRLINKLNEGYSITADEVFFRQVIDNLVNNAIKFTPPKGQVTCYATGPAECHELIISDNGIGMPENLTPDKLFSMHRVDSRRGTQNEKGTGVGLGICKKILNAHGYGFTFRRNSEGGTDFLIIVSRK
jgi:two-component system sensor histidine kinase/response regulator